MKNILLSSLFIFLFVVGINAQTTVMLGGNVYYEGIVGSLPVEPAPGVVVTMKKTIVVNGNPQVSTSTTSTDSSGFFSFTTDAECGGTWEFKAVSSLVIDGEALPPSNQSSVSGCLTQDITNLQMRITRPYPITVSGHVKDTTGAPVPGVLVRLKTNKYDYEPDEISYKATATDGNGFYVFQVFTRCSVVYEPILVGGNGIFYPIGSTSGCVYQDTTLNRTVLVADRAFWMTVSNMGCSPEEEKVGLPVNVTNGNVYLQQMDYDLQGVGESIDVVRTYNSLSTYSGLFGAGWTTKYDERIVAYDNFMLRLQLGDGKLIYFERKNSSLPFTPLTAGFYGQIVKNTDNTFTLTFKNGNNHSFNSAGVLTAMLDRHNNQTVLNYDGLGRLASLVDPYGRTLTVSTDGAGKITGLSDAVGAVAAYVYNTNGTLQSVTYPDGSKFAFTYITQTDSSGTHRLLTEVKDALNNILEKHDYYANGKAETSESANGVEKFTLSYTSAAQTTVTDALNRTTNYYFNNIGGKNVVIKTEGLCGCGGGETNEYFYDGQTNITKKINALGHETLYTYDTNGNMLTRTDPTGTQTYTYNSHGQVLTAKDQMNGITTMTYNAQGRPTEIKDALDKITTFDYYSTGELKSVTNARGKTTNYLWENGSLKRITDANGKQTNLVFDGRARVETETNALGHVTTYNYDLNNRIKKVIYPDTKFIEYKYDLAGRVEWIQDARGNKTTYGYDPLSSERLKTVTDALNHTTTYDYDLMSNLKSVTDAEGKTTDYTIDDFNRVKEIIYPPAVTGATRLKEIFTFDSVGHVKTRTDTANRVTTYDYDAAGRLWKATNPESEVTQFEYNARSQTTKVKDALNQEYVLTYDALGRQLSQTRSGTTVAYEYDAVGNKSKRTDYMGKVTTYGYDNLNRLETIDYLDTAPPHASIETVTYTYDDLSRMLTATNYAGTVSFTYDNRNRTTSTTDVFAHLVEYEYDENGNRTLLKLDGQPHASYVYDAVNRLTTLTDEASQNFTFGYDATDRLITKTLPNNVVTTYNYDGLSRLTGLKHQSATTTLLDNQYAYNPAQQISQITELGQTRTFTYDNADRLTAATNPTLGNESYSYDDVGNRTASHLSSTYGYQPFNKLVSTDTLTYDYNANGSMVSKSNGINFPGSYTWDYENRLTRAKNPGPWSMVSANYQYDALGRRVSRTVYTQWEKYTYDGFDVVLDEGRYGSNTYQNEPGIDNKLKVNEGGSDSYFLPDHLGSTFGLTDSNGDMLAEMSYDSFGNPSANGNSGSRYQFTGREYDDYSGLYYYRARWYDPNLGRFIGEDPIGFAGGDANLYGYVKNNPVNFTDPTGTEVFAILYRSKGKLVVYDFSKHWWWKTDQSTEHHFKVFSGDTNSFCMNSNLCDTNENEGPIPRGAYLIDDKVDEFADEAWKRISYRVTRSKNNTKPWEGPFGKLSEKVAITDPFSGKVVYRGGFYLHPGSMSAGCITFPKTTKLPSGAPWSEDYGRFDKIIKGTTPYTYNNQNFAGRLVVVD